MDANLIDKLRSELHALETNIAHRESELTRLKEKVRGLRIFLGAETKENVLFVSVSKPEKMQESVSTDLTGLSVREAVAVALKSFPNGANGTEVAKWLENNGYEYKGKTRFSDRIRNEMRWLVKRNRADRLENARYRLK